MRAVITDDCACWCARAQSNQRVMVCFAGVRSGRTLLTGQTCVPGSISMKLLYAEWRRNGRHADRTNLVKKCLQQSNYRQHIHIQHLHGYLTGLPFGRTARAATKPIGPAQNRVAGHPPYRELTTKMFQLSLTRLASVFKGLEYPIWLYTREPPTTAAVQSVTLLP